MQIISGLIVSVDAFFIGLSLGLQKGCKFAYLVVINMFLLGLCIIGFLIAGHIYELIPFDPDLVVGFAFIALGVLYTFQYFVYQRKNRFIGRGSLPPSEAVSYKTIVFVGLVMGLEAMLISMGITFIFQPYSTFVIPITVAFAHLAYSAFSFWLARTKHVKRMPTVICHIISGGALIVYGLLALFVEII